MGKRTRGMYDCGECGTRMEPQPDPQKRFGANATPLKCPTCGYTELQVRNAPDSQTHDNSELPPL